MADKKTKNILYKTIFISSGIILLIFILWLFNAFETLEYITLDSRYTNRIFKKPVISEEILNIIIDDAAIEQVGRWPWSWDKLKIIIDAANYYSAKSCAFVDINFNRESNVYLSNDAAGLLKNNIQSYIINNHDTLTIVGAIENKNKEFLTAINYYPNIFLVSNFYVPEIELSYNNLKLLTEEKKKDILSDRQENINSMDRFVIKNAINKDKLTIAIDFIPPLKSLNLAVKGVGYNRIFSDADGIIRKYSMAINYDDKIYPSFITLMAANYYNCPIDSIALNPGKYLEFSTGDSVISISPTQTKKIKYPIRIPIDNSGMMYINWSGAYKDTFKNIPYNLIAMHYSYIIAKKYLSNFAVGAVDANQVFNGLNQELLKAGITSSDNAEVIAVKMFSAWLMEFFYNNNMTYQDFLAQMGADDDIELKKIWTQIVFNNKLFDKLKDTNSPQYDEILKEMNIDINDTNYRDVILEGWKQTVFFYSRGMINQMRPLFFPAPSNLKIGLRTEQISLLELTNKIIFTGLTATGLAAFNPMPFEDRYMMLGMPANVMNTIITNQYLKPANFILMALIFIILIFFITFFTMRSTTVGSIAAVLLFIIYPLIAWYLFNVGYILPIVPFSLGILLSLLSAIAYKFIEVQRERKKIKNMFSTMVAPEVLKIIEENPDKFNLSGELREATMFSSDVSGFTTISEGVTAQELANILNIYLTPMSNIVMKYNGYIDKYEGDAIKADFGVLPLQSSSEWKLDSEHSWKCCYSALEQQEELSVIQRMIQIKYGVKISARMGVNTGVVSAGNMGSEKKRQFSVMGAAVTLAEELEPINKIFETWIAIGPSTYEKSKTYIETRFLNYLITHEDQPLLPVNELLGWKTEKFLEYWLGKPVPQLILEGIRNMAPEKILGYHHYYTHKKLPDTEFIMQIKKRFADLVAPSIAFIQNNDILSVNDLVEELANLNIKFKQYYNDGDFDKAAARKDYIAFKEKLSSVKKNWEKHIIEWKMQITLFLNLLLYVDTKLETKISEDLYKIVDTLEKRIECFNKRCQFTPANDEIACEIGNHLQNLIENNKMQINKIEIENKINKIKSEISANLNAMADFIIANSDDYHRMISAYCEVSEKKRKVIEMFKNAREFYLKKQFEKAIEVFKEILTIDPNDGPSAKYIAYIQKLKKDDLPEDWNGAWHAE